MKRCSCYRAPLDLRNEGFERLLGESTRREVADRLHARSADRRGAHGPLRLGLEPLDGRAGHVLGDPVSNEIVEDEKVAAAAIGEVAGPALRVSSVVDEPRSLGAVEDLAALALRDPRAGETTVERLARVLPPRECPQRHLLGAETPPRPHDRADASAVELDPDRDAGLHQRIQRECPPRCAVELDGNAGMGLPERRDGRQLEA